METTRGRPVGLQRSGRGWRVPMDPSRHAALPPDWVFTAYCRLEPPALFRLGDLTDLLGSYSKARQFVHAAVQHRWIVRTDRGEYAALDPSTTIRISAVSGYWKELIAIDEALTIKDVPHAFACLTIMELSDYLPDRPFLVVPHATDGGLAVDSFGFDVSPSRVQKIILWGKTFQVRSTVAPDTVMLLQATHLPRETSAARQIVERIKVGKRFARRLNFLGLSTREDVYESEDPNVQLPQFILDRRKSLAEEILKEGSS